MEPPVMVWTIKLLTLSTIAFGHEEPMDENKRNCGFGEDPKKALEALTCGHAVQYRKKVTGCRHEINMCPTIVHVVFASLVAKTGHTPATMACAGILSLAAEAICKFVISPASPVPNT